MKRVAIIGSAAAMMAVLAAPVQAQQLRSAIQTSQQTVNDTARSQQRIDDLDAQTQSLLNDYRANLKQLEQLKRYNETQRKNLAAQEREKESLLVDIDSISGLQRSVQPLMEDMLASLEQFVAADIPFLEAERVGRVERLKAIMADPDQSVAQRYRLIVEAFQIENEYGRTIEAYRATVSDEGEVRENVEHLRIGRLSLIYKTDDDSALRIWDADARAWTDLDRSFLPAVRTGLRMAKEQIPPALMTIPVSAPEGGE